MSARAGREHLPAVVLETEADKKAFHGKAEILIGEIGAPETDDEVGADAPGQSKRVSWRDELYWLGAHRPQVATGGHSERYSEEEPGLITSCLSTGQGRADACAEEARTEEPSYAHQSPRN